MKSTRIYFSILNVSFWSLLILQVIFLSVSIWIIRPHKEEEFFIEFIISDFIIIVICLLLAFYYPRRLFQQAKLKKGIREKLIKYRKALYLRWILIFIATIYSIIEYLLTSERAFVCTSIFLIIVFLLTKISKEVLCEHLDLDSKERSVIYNPNAAI